VTVATASGGSAVMSRFPIGTHPFDAVPIHLFASPQLWRAY
jgi:hypothetical protein